MKHRQMELLLYLSHFNSFWRQIVLLTSCHMKLILYLFLALEDIYEISPHVVVTVLKPFYFFLAPKSIIDILSHEAGHLFVSGARIYL